MALATNALMMIGWRIGNEPHLPLTGVVLNALFVGGWALAHLGHWRLSSLIPTSLVFLATVYDNYLEGVGAPAMLYYAEAILLAAMLQGPRIQWLMAGLCIASYLGLGLARVLGLLSPPPPLR
jgi:hypothetical protein